MNAFNQVNLKVILNHKEQRNFDNKLFTVYTFTDFLSGNSFDCWVTSTIDYIENMKLLLEFKEIIFSVQIKKDGKVKLLPLPLCK